MLLSDEVGEAIAAGRAVVALESTIIAHGLPRPDNLRVADAQSKPTTPPVDDAAIPDGPGPLFHFARLDDSREPMAARAACFFSDSPSPFGRPGVSRRRDQARLSTATQACWSKSEPATIVNTEAIVRANRGSRRYVSRYAVPTHCPRQ